MRAPHWAVGDEGQSVDHNKPGSNLILGGAGLIIPVLYSGKGRSTKEFSFVIMRRGKARGEQTLTSFHPAKVIHISACTNTQRFLPASSALRLWNVTQVTNFILICIGA